MITDEQLAKLPKYARMEITRLRRDNESYREKLTAGPENSDTFVDSYDNTRPLGTGERIKFVLSRREDGRVEEYVDARIDEGRVRISTNKFMIVRPCSSNVIEVHPYDD